MSKIVSKAIISAYLDDIIYPTTKEHILVHAHGRQAPSEVITSLEKIRGGKFYTIAGTWDAVDAING